jgi:heme/copper-type cytochrome/quinol oxidase subunit 3
MFGIGGLTGLPLGLAASDVALHDTWYVVAHFHYLVAPGTVFALFAGIYHYWPRITGRALNETLGKIHFWGSFVCMNLIFLPMFAIGLMGVNRRLWDAGASYAHAQPTLQWQTHMTYAAFLLAAFQLPFIWNLVKHLRPLEGDGFSRRHAEGHDVEGRQATAEAVALQTSHTLRADTGTTSARLGIWLFLASEAMFFASLLSGYVMLRAGSTTWPDRFGGFPWLETVLLVGASAAFGAGRFRLIASHALALTFVVIKLATDLSAMNKGLLPATDLMLASWYTLTWVHAFHVLAGAVWIGWLAGPSFRMTEDERERFEARVDATRKYWLFVDAVWLVIVVSFYFV